MSQTKEKFSSVLVSIDGSEASMKAADYAIMTAKRNDAQLTALHVLYSQTGYAYSSGTFGGLVTPSSIRAIYESAKQEAQQWFDQVKEKINEQEKEEQKEKNQIQLKTELVVTATSVAAAIVGYSEQHDIDLIVIGTRGRSGFKKLLLGSVASGVATYARCPVMVVK
jgi:nucleotide-binding universal stress UspA family protein